MARSAARSATPVSAEILAAAAEDRGAGLALFVLSHTGSILGCWRGRLSAADQRGLFGRAIGRGLFRIDGDREQVSMSVQVCFGTDSETTFRSSWVDLAYPAA